MGLVSSPRGRESPHRPTGHDTDVGRSACRVRPALREHVGARPRPSRSCPLPFCMSLGLPSGHTTCRRELCGSKLRLCPHITSETGVPTPFTGSRSQLRYRMKPRMTAGPGRPPACESSSRGGSAPTGPVSGSPSPVLGGSRPRGFQGDLLPQPQPLRVLGHLFLCGEQQTCDSLPSRATCATVLPTFCGFPLSQKTLPDVSKPQTAARCWAISMSREPWAEGASGPDPLAAPAPTHTTPGHAGSQRGHGAGREAPAPALSRPRSAHGLKDGFRVGCGDSRAGGGGEKKGGKKTSAYRALGTGQTLSKPSLRRGSAFTPNTFLGVWPKC